MAHALATHSKVAYLDDEAGAHKILAHALADFELQSYSCSERFLSTLDERTDCILLDIQMPDSSDNGYEVCRHLRRSPATRHTPIIFVSANTGLDSRLQGYAAGADDFISKPYDLNELRAKVERALAVKAHSQELESIADEARQTAFEAMTHSSEQGEITRFIEQAGSCQTSAQLADMLIATLKNFGLNSVVACWAGKPPLFLSHQAMPKPLETELLSSCRFGKRIIELERRMVVNFDQVSVLIKNSPWQEEARYGRIKDHLCVLMSAVNERLLALKTEQKMLQQSQLLAAVGGIKDALSGLQQMRQQRLAAARETVQELDLELKEEVLLLNLDADQEISLTALVHQHVQNLDECYRSSCEFQHALQPIVNQLEAIAAGGAEKKWLLRS